MLIEKPNMPNEDSGLGTVSVGQVELDTDPYQAQLMLAKAKRVEAATELVEKAAKDKKVIKSMEKASRGRGRGRGRGRSHVVEASAPPPATTSAPAAATAELPPAATAAPAAATAEEADATVPPEHEGSEVPKKQYKRKVLSPDELTTMWNSKVSWFYVAACFPFLASKTATLLETRGKIGSGFGFCL